MRADDLDVSLPTPVRQDRSPQASFHAQVNARLACAAAENGGTHDVDIAIGPVAFRLAFAGDALLEPFTRALSHLQVQLQAAPDTHIGLWDIASTRVGLPPPPWPGTAYSYSGQVLGYNDEQYTTLFHPDGRILFLYDAAARRGTVAVFDRRQLPSYELAAPLRPLLSRILQLHGIQALHAAGVALPDGGVLFAGRGGVGKSTSTLACLDSPLRLAGDDYCAVGVQSSVVYSLYNSAKANAVTVGLLPFLEPLITNWATWGEDKAVWYLAESFPDKLIREFPLRAILIPRITGVRETRVAPAPRSAALLALAPTTVAQLPNAQVQALENVSMLARSVPAYYLNLGTALDQVPHAVLGVLRAQGVCP